MMRKLLMTLMALGIALVLAACGGDDESSDKDNGGGSDKMDRLLNSRRRCLSLT